MKIDGGLMGTDLEVLAADSPRARSRRLRRGLSPPRRATIRSCRCSSPRSTPTGSSCRPGSRSRSRATPMMLANVAYDLQAFSKGRFILGLG